MSRRRKNRLGPDILPLLRDDLIYFYDLEAEYLHEQISAFGTPAPMEKDPYRLEDGALWWVTRDMAKLAATAAQTLPADVTVEECRPSLSGVIVWEAPVMQFAQGPSKGYEYHITVTGAVWKPDGKITPLVTGAKTPEWKFGICPETLAIDRDFETEVEKILCSTWLLADQPGLATTRTSQSTLRRVTQPKIPGHKSTIKTVLLRRPPQVPRETTPREEAESWFTVRFPVNGHWRNQACGPQHRDRRRTYVHPYIKGPADAPLVDRPTVHVWKK